MIASDAQVSPHTYMQCPPSIPSYSTVSLHTDSRLVTQSERLPSPVGAIPTNRETGYSSMIRPDKFHPLPGPSPGYDKVTAKQDGDDVQKQIQTFCTTDVACPLDSHSQPEQVLSDSSVKACGEKCVNITDPDTGY